MQRVWLSLAVLVLAIDALPAFGVVTPVSQGRRLQTFAVYAPAQGAPESTQEVIDFLELGEWTDEAVCHVGEPGAEATGTAFIISRIDETGASIIASTRGEAENRVPEDFGEGFGFSRISYVFSVDEATPCRVMVTAREEGNGSFNFLLRVLDGPFVILAPFDEPEIHIDEMVQLQPGTYELTASSGGFGQAFNEMQTIALVDYAIDLTFPATSSAPSSPVAIAPVAQPNPFVESTRISLRNATGPETVEVLDVAGRVVRRLDVRGEGSVEWNGRDENGTRAGAGVYFVRAGSGETTRVVRMR